MVQFNSEPQNLYSGSSWAEPFFRRSEELALSEAEGISRLPGLTPTPNCTTTCVFIGLTLPIQRVINARFALVRRHRGLILSGGFFRRSLFHIQRELRRGQAPTPEVLRWKRVRNSETDVHGSTGRAHGCESLAIRVSRVWMLLPEGCA